MTTTQNQRDFDSYKDDLLQAVNLVNLIERHTKTTLKRSGATFKTTCCFHEEKTPSLHIYPNDNKYHCYGCGAHGDAITFLMEYLRLTFEDALAELSSITGIKNPRTYSKTPRGTPISVIRSIFDDATSYYVKNLENGENDGTALEYIYERRGFDNLDFITRQQIGVTSPKHSLFDFLKATGKYSLDNLVDSTLISRKDDRYYDYFGNHWGQRIIIPIRRWGGNTIGFTSRIFLPSDEVLAKERKFGKYINTKEVKFFSKKSEWLDGIDFLPKAGGNIIVVEGNLDRLQAVYHGYPAVAIGSAQLSKEQIKTLLLLTGYGSRGKIILCLDGDDAGEKGSYDSVIKAFSHLENGGSLWVAQIPFEQGKKVDVDDVLRKQGKKTFDAILDNAVPATEFFKQRIIARIGVHHDKNDPQYQASIDRAVSDALVDVQPPFKDLVVKYTTQHLTQKSVSIPTADPDWEAALIRKPPTKKQEAEGLPGSLIPNEFNIKQILKNDDAWRGAIGFNSFGKKIVKLTPKFMPIEQSAESTQNWVDGDDFNTTAWLNKNYGVNARVNMVSAAIAVVAVENCFHPVYDYLEGLCWDGIPRITTWLQDYLLSSQNADYLALVGRIWLVSAVARIYKPGCKVDTVPILEGKQGVRKSSAIESLCPDKAWHSDTTISLASRDAYASLPGAWLFELAEMKSVLTTDAETAKAFFSSREDRFINKYEKSPVTYPRQCIFIGTTNMEGYLRDETGNRRFLPIRCGEDQYHLKIDELERDRDQLWAEAVHLFKQGAKWWADGEDEDNLLISEQQQRAEADPWDNIIATYAEGRGPVTVEDIMSTALEIPKEQHTRKDQMRISRILKRMGWESDIGKIAGKTKRCYIKKR